MSSNLSGVRERATFLQSSDTGEQAARAAILLDLLCFIRTNRQRAFSRRLAGGAITVDVLQQGVVHELPSQLAGTLPGKRFLRRLVTLGANDLVMLDALTYIAVPEPRPLVAIERASGSVLDSWPSGCVPT